MLLSIVLPAFNEEHRIGKPLEQLIAHRAACGYHLEVILVDDGSTDATAAVAQSYVDDLPELRILRHDSNHGKGRAVATGMLASRGHYRAFFDADGSTAISEVDTLLDAIRQTPRAVAIGSLRARGSRIGRKQPVHRNLAGRLGNALIRGTVLPGIADSQRGCKMFPAELSDLVFGAQQTDGWGFDIEILALTQRLGYRIVEVPISWSHVEGGQLRAGAYVSTVGEVFRIRRLLRSDAHQMDVVRSRLQGPRPLGRAKRRTA